MSGRIHFIDWMKASGMFLIVYGHTSGHALFNPTLPVNLKQIGVVFFVLATGYLLADEKRPWPRVLFNRLFELFLFGVGFSLLLSVINFFRIGDINESNYLPFALGLNVLFDAFPANSSTWYIGTYIHLLLLWAVVLRRIRVRPWMILLWLPIEVFLRAWLMDAFGDYVAYQALCNWLGILLMGMYLGQRGVGDLGSESRRTLYGHLVGLVFAVAAWLWWVKGVGVTSSNPFGRLLIGTEGEQLAFTAASVSFVYFAWAYLGFQLLRHFKAGPFVRFLSRNSMLCFIFHMPLIKALTPLLYALPGIDSPGLLRLAVNILIFYVGVSLVAEQIRRFVAPARLKALAEQRFQSVQPARNSVR
ncbi:MAG: acyltransferase [Pseudomonadales bacterium]|jgi:hypothetical protein|nr:acyltransferase [Pseudomonadales bacterium]